ncbi:hypothetical protein [Saccharopolyspora sp. NPDC002376]
MAGFDLSKQVKALDWNFGDGVRGTVPEPSPKSVNRFQTRMRENIKATGRDLDMSSMDELIRVLGSLTEDDLNSIYEENLDAVAELCDSSPSRDQLAELPHRGFQAFLGWITGELTPEGARPATSR